MAAKHEINERWPERRGARAAPGRSPLRIIAQQIGVAEHKIKMLAEKRGISYEAAAEELADNKGRPDWMLDPVFLPRRS